jgi:4-diphosphocytidyl-2-C-methyl-D-erythritol kinase
LSLTVRLRAFAKINLGLKIIGKRPDGYHEIQTLYQTIELHDRLSISLGGVSSAIQVECDDPRVPAGEANLVYRACELWSRALQFRGSIHVRLAKKIPMGSGLGGASADAAAALLGLERLTGDRLDLESRLHLGARLGSDVPLFFWGGRVLGCGRGEEVYPLWDLPSRACLVIFPGFGVSTAWAYRLAGRGTPSLQLTEGIKNPNMKRFGAWSHFPLKDWGPAENDFERVVFARWPELAQLKRRLIRAGAESASLTGSGSAVFAVRQPTDSARKLLRASKFIPAGWQMFPTRTLPRAEYERLVFA